MAVKDTKHTPGPVRWEKLRGNCVSLEVDGPREPGRKARILIHNADWPMTEADIRRIQALWNACEGIPTEALESGVVREMAEELERAVEHVRGLIDRTACACGFGYVCAAHAAADRCEAVLAKARGGGRL